MFKPALALLVVLLAAPALAQHDHAHGGGNAPVADIGRLGRVEFANSGAPAAQPAFLRGMALLHSFLYREARIAFQEALRIDPRFAMAYWGELMAAQDSAASDSILRRMAPTPARRLAMAGSDRERAYLRIAARFVLMGEDAADSDSAAEAWAESWRRLHESYPEDDDAALYYALSLIDLRYRRADDGDASLRASVEAARLAEDVFARRPDHPGAAHYLIHAYDDARLAPLGLRAARAYAAIAPAAHHAVHMPSHIFFHFGRWPDVVAANERAWALSKSSTGGAGLPPEEWDYHAADWLHYAFLQQGRVAAAEALADTIRRAWTEERIAAAPAYMRDFVKHRISDLEARSAIERRRWEGGYPESGPAMDVVMLHAGRSAAARRDTTLAIRLVGRSEHVNDSLRIAHPDRPGRTPLILRQLRSMVMLARGDTAGAVAELRTAADSAEARPSLNLAEGPQRANAGTTRVILGEVLLESGDHAGALAEFDRALALSPGRSAALLGRARALAGLGRAPEAALAYARVMENWQRADADFPGLAEARVGAAAAATP